MYRRSRKLFHCGAGFQPATPESQGGWKPAPQWLISSVLFTGVYHCLDVFQRGISSALVTGG